MIAVDTNVLIYAHDSRDERKRRIAIDLVETIDDGVLLWQVACEYLWASRKLELQDYSYADAFSDIQDLSAGWRIAVPTWLVLNRARTLRARGFSHWDALLIAACFEAGVDTLMSEDFREVKRIDGLQIVNPFGD